MASDTLHEDPDKLGAEVIDRHRAIVSIMEELEAVDWYDQRAKATSNAELRSILEQTIATRKRKHAAMTLEWLRRNDPKMDEHLRTFLFKEGPVTQIEASMMGKEEDGDGSQGSDGSLGIGSLRKVNKK